MIGRHEEFWGPGNGGQTARRLGRTYALITVAGTIVLLALLGYAFEAQFGSTPKSVIGTAAFFLLVFFFTFALGWNGFRATRLQFRLARGPDTIRPRYALDNVGLTLLGGLAGNSGHGATIFGVFAGETNRIFPWTSMRGLTVGGGRLRLRYRLPTMAMDRTLALDGAFATREGMTFGHRFRELYEEAHPSSSIPPAPPPLAPLKARSSPAMTEPDKPLEPFQIARRGASAHVQLTLIGAPLSVAPEVIAGDVVSLFKDTTGLLSLGQTVAFASPFGTTCGITITPGSWPNARVVEVYLDRTLMRTWRVAPGQATLLDDPTSEPSLKDDIPPDAVIDLKPRPIIPGTASCSSGRASRRPLRPKRRRGRASRSGGRDWA